MANPEHEAKLKRGVEEWNAWRRANRDVRPDLRGLKLPDSELSGVDLTYADLRGADLARSQLVRADLRRTALEKAHLEDANLERANLRWANLQATYLDRANLRGAVLYWSLLERTELNGADLTGSYVYGTAVWNPKLEGTIQDEMVVTYRNEPTVTVDSLEVAQFVYLLLSNVKIRRVIDTVTSKVVLILGRFSEERKAVLDAIRKELRGDEFDYVPVVFDFVKPASRDLEETVTLLARMARFIIADISDPKSIPQELGAIVKELPSVPVQPLLCEGFEPWAMYERIRRYPWVLPVAPYRSAEDLLPRLRRQVVQPAEAMVETQRPEAGV